MGYSPATEKEIPVFGPSWNMVPEIDAIFINNEYIDELHIFSDREVERINKKVGIDNFVCVPRELGAGGLQDFYIDIAIGLISAGIFEAMKYALIKIFSGIKKKVEKEERGHIYFRVGSPESNINFEFKADLNGDAKEIENSLKKAIEIVEIINRKDYEGDKN